MKTIWRYDLQFDFDEKQTLVATLTVPTCANVAGPDAEYCILSAQYQIIKVDTIRGIPSIWFMVDTERATREVKIYAYGTGHEIAEDIERKDYIGSFIIGPEIYHCFIK